MGDPLPNRAQALPSGVFTQSDNPSLERSIIKNEARLGRVRQHSHLSQSESSGAEEEQLSLSADLTTSYARSPVLQGTAAQGVLYHRSTFEQAESNHQCWVPSNGNKVLSSSPRSPNTRSFFSRGQHQNKGHPADTIKASGTQAHQSGRGRNRTSSETEARAKSSWTPTQRKRGLSETERRPMRDKYDRSSREWFRHACLWLFTIGNIASTLGWLHFCLAFLCFIAYRACRASCKRVNRWLHVCEDTLVWMQVTFFQCSTSSSGGAAGAPS